MYEQYPDTDQPLVLTEKDVRFLREHVAPIHMFGSDSDDMTFEVCPGCARPIWKETKAGGTAQTIAHLGTNLCDRCEAFRYRHPEVYGFVTTHAQAGRFIHTRLVPKTSDEEKGG